MALALSKKRLELRLREVARESWREGVGAGPKS
jgi:hypothetical protein